MHSGELILGVLKGKKFGRVRNDHMATYVRELSRKVQERNQQRWANMNGSMIIVEFILGSAASVSRCGHLII